MVKMVLSRPCHPDDQFTTSILRHWCIKHDDLLAEHIKSLLIKNNSLPRKRQSWGSLISPPVTYSQQDPCHPERARVSGAKPWCCPCAPAIGHSWMFPEQIVFQMWLEREAG
ncbi:integrator complex subunit 3 [Limosa lapponica baueri]|uniref:Integrator complex subunit 3 n=1 Tax=Limosa lapponica baueri TaxID=1758121 RepID=A0A2I0SZZ5_LIMLA|nr:integrator complex subunit 3 [Limosa lapponica baueri]